MSFYCLILFVLVSLFVSFSRSNMKCTFVLVGSEKIHILLKVKVQLFVFFVCFFKMSQLDTNGCLIFF